MKRLLPARRSFLGALAGMPCAGGFVSGQRAFAAEAAPARDVLKELGVRTFINAAGTFTAMSGSLMAPEVMAAMQAASRKFVKLEDLHNAVG
jgi:D-glucosaminate-6-phosphate ammonia-lyase